MDIVLVAVGVGVGVGVGVDVGFGDGVGLGGIIVYPRCLGRSLVLSLGCQLLYPAQLVKPYVIPDGHSLQILLTTIKPVSVGGTDNLTLGDWSVVKRPGQAVGEYPAT